MVKHLAVIMDGNGRWAAKHNLPKVEGHRKGAEAAKLLVQNAVKFGIEYLTLYTFSSENWNRPKLEVSDLLGLLGFYLKQELLNLHNNNIRIKVIGDLSPIAPDLRNQIKNAIETTRNNTKLTLCLAFSYGGRLEIINACNTIAHQSKSNVTTESEFGQYLYDSEMPDVDLLIRTSGDKRISNFLLWHIAYAELYFIDTLWPDFGEQDLSDAIQDFAARKRNFGFTRNN